MNPSISRLVGKTPPRDVASGSYRECLLVAVFILFTSFSFFLIQYDRMRTAGPGIDSLIRNSLAGVMPHPTSTASVSLSSFISYSYTLTSDPTSPFR